MDYAVNFAVEGGPQSVFEILEKIRPAPSPLNARLERQVKAQVSVGDEKYSDVIHTFLSTPCEAEFINAETGRFKT